MIKLPNGSVYLIVCVAVVVLVVCVMLIDERWRRECVKRGVAGYDTTTGDWQWTVAPKSEQLLEHKETAVPSVVIQKPEQPARLTAPTNSEE